MWLYYIVLLNIIISIIAILLLSFRKLMQSQHNPVRKMQDLHLRLLIKNQLRVEKVTNSTLSLHTILSIHSLEVTVLIASLMFRPAVWCSSSKHLPNHILICFYLLVFTLMPLLQPALFFKIKMTVLQITGNKLIPCLKFTC